MGGGVLGRGEFATVNQAEHVETRERVAVKNIDTNKSCLDKIREEISNHRSLCHRHVLGLRDVIETPGNALMVLDYAGGGDLFDRIVSKGRLPEREARRYFQQIIAGLDHCHANMVAHRDLKPENILLDTEDNVKISDFGLSAKFSEGELLHQSCGSPNYAAPELLRSRFAYMGPAVDVWSCGCILYAMLTGSLPFDADTTSALFRLIKKGQHRMQPFFSSGAQDLISQMLTVDPTARISTAQIKEHSWFLQDLPAELMNAKPEPPPVNTRTELAHDADLGCDMQRIGRGPVDLEFISTFKQTLLPALLSKLGLFLLAQQPPQPVALRPRAQTMPIINLPL